MAIDPVMWAKLEYESRQSETAERLRFLMEFAHAVLRGLTLANGGAIIALFTFIGNTDSEPSSRAIWWAFLLFAAGLAFTLFTAILAYLSQGNNLQATYREALNAKATMFGETEQEDSGSYEKWGSRFENTAIFTAILSLLCFIGGAAFALQAGLIS